MGHTDQSRRSELHGRSWCLQQQLVKHILLELGTCHRYRGGEWEFDGCDCSQVVHLGGRTTFSVTVEQATGPSASDANLEVQVLYSSGNAIMSNVWGAQSLSAGQSQTYAYTWNVLSTLATGNYAMVLGVFNSRWNTDCTWNGNLSTLTIP